jgi:cohesin complex subunit SA-1/2
VRVAVAGFVTGMLEALVDEQKEQLGEEPSSKQTQALEAYETELAKLRLKCFAELLVRFAARLDKPAGDENGDAAESSRAKEQADELSWSLGGLEEGRVGLAVNALWDAVEGAQQWRPLIELLLYDHSGAGASAAPGRAKGKKGKSAAASAAGSSSNSSADTAVTGVQLTNQVYRLEPEEEAVLVEALVAVLSKTKAQAANAGPRPDRPAHGPLSDEDEAAEDDPVKSLASMTRDLIPALPKLFSKYRTDAPRIADVLLVPRYMNLELYLEAQQSTAYEALWDEISDQFLRHVEPALLANAVAAISRLVQTDTLANVNATKLTALHENLTAALREPVQGRDVEAAAFDENEIHLLMACTRRMRHLARVTDMSAAIEDDEKGSQTSAWNIVLGLASRGRLGYPDESQVSDAKTDCLSWLTCVHQLIENSLGVLSLYIMWKTHAVVQTQDHAQKNALVEALVDKRDTLLDLMNSFVAGSHGNTASGVQQEAFRHTLDVYIMHGNMAAASDAAEAAAQQNGGADAAAAGRPKLPAAMRLECPVEVQHRCAGFIQAELERYAEELRASFPSDAPADAESELSDAEEEQDEDDDGNSPAPAPKKGKKGKKAAPATAAAADKTPARPTQEFLQRQQQLCQTLSHFIAAIRLGTFDVKHAAGVLAYHGRLGHIFDSCSKVLVETLREEGVYAGRPDMACNVILDALKQVSIAASCQPLCSSRIPSVGGAVGAGPDNSGRGVLCGPRAGTQQRASGARRPSDCAACHPGRRSCPLAQQRLRARHQAAHGCRARWQPGQ